MSAVYSNLGETGRAAENARKAYDLREKVSEPERFFIEGTYYWNGTGELEKAVPVYELWQQTYPRDYSLYDHLGLIHGQLGNLEKALEEHREAMRLEPNAQDIYAGLGNDYVYLNRLDEAEAVYKQAEERKLGVRRYLSSVTCWRSRRVMRHKWRSWPRPPRESRARKTCCWPCRRTPKLGTGS